MHSTGAVGLRLAALRGIAWQTPVDLSPQFSGEDLLIHYGSPLITAQNTIVLPVKTGLQAASKSRASTPRRANSNGPKRRTTSAAAQLGAELLAHADAVEPALLRRRRRHGLLHRFARRSPAQQPPASSAFFGLSNYTRQPRRLQQHGLHQHADHVGRSGNIFFGFLVTGSNPLGLNSGVARIAAPTAASLVAAVGAPATGMSRSRPTPPRP